MEKIIKGMIVRVVFFICLLSLWNNQFLSAGEPYLPDKAAKLYAQAKGGRWYQKAAKLQPAILPTSDGKSFIVVWKATPSPKWWIVSLHGSEGFATDDLAVWHPNIQDRNIGLVCLQWWFGEGDSINSYYRPEQIYREIDIVLQKLGVRKAMLHGFSRGAANSYAVAALDAGRGQRYFTLIVASSGGVNETYPPTHAILKGAFGNRPLQGTRWITVAGRLDPHPDRDGIPAMRRTANWLRSQGAIIVDVIEDPDEGHGALQRNPQNIRRVLNIFCQDNY